MIYVKCGGYVYLVLVYAARCISMLVLMMMFVVNSNVHSIMFSLTVRTVLVMGWYGWSPWCRSWRWTFMFGPVCLQCAPVGFVMLALFTRYPRSRRRLVETCITLDAFTYYKKMLPTFVYVCLVFIKLWTYSK